MKNLGLWLRWSWRDLRSRWLQVAAIALIIALGIGMFSGLTGQGDWRLASMDLNYERLHMYDFHLELADGSYVDQAAVLEALTGINGVKQVDTRLMTPTLVEASPEGKDILVRGKIVGVDVADNGPSISNLYVAEDDGRALSAGDTGQNVAVVEVKFANYHHLKPGDPFRVSGDVSLDVVGVGVTPETFMIIPEAGTFFAEGSYAIVFVSLETAQRLAGHEGLVNDVVFLLDDGADPDAVRAEIESRMAEAFPETGIKALTNRADDFAYSAMRDEITQIQETWTSIGTLFLLGAAVGAFNLIGRMVESQRREIGIGMALGMPRRWIALRPCLVGLQVAILGTALGPLFGIALGQTFANYQQTMLSLPYIADFMPYLGNIPQGIAMGIIIPLVAVVIPVWRAVRVAPVDAITTGYMVAKGGGLNRLLNHIPLPGKSFVQMPIRNILRAPWRTMLTILGITIAIMLLTGIIGTMDVMLNTFDQIDAAYRYRGGERFLVNLNTFYPVDSDTVTTLTALTGNDGVPLFAQTETDLMVSGKLIANAEEQEVVIELYDMANAGIWRPALLEGTLTADQPGIVISQKSAEDLGVKVGDTITVEHPFREGPMAFRIQQTDMPIIGIHDNPLRPLSYMDSSNAAIMGLEGFTNYLLLDPASGVEPNVIRSALMTQPGVASAKSVAEFSESVQDYMAVAISMIALIAIVMVAFAFLIAFNSTSISLDERRRETATMFAFGLRIRTVIRMQMMENLVMGTVGTVIGVIIGTGVVSAIMKTQEESAQDFKFLLTLSPDTVLLALALGILVVALTPLLSIRRMRKMDIPSTLRVME
jgi:putative ABC transport system permease protein